MSDLRSWAEHGAPSAERKGNEVSEEGGGRVTEAGWREIAILVAALAWWGGA